MYGMYILIVSTDVDECEVDKSLCPDATQVCVNVPGSYLCACAPGYRKQAGGHCAGQCSPVTTSTVSVYSCLYYTNSY